LKIAILGTQGIPARYGGSETCAEETSIRLVKKGHEVTVYGRSPKFKTEKSIYKDVRIVNLPSIPFKNLDYPIRGFFSTIRAIFKGYDVYHLTGPDSGFYAIFLRLFRRRKNIVVTLDGFPEDKESYSKFTKFLLKFVFKLSVKLPNIVIVDSNYILGKLKSKFKRDFEYVPYGGIISENEVDQDVLVKYNLEYKKYYLFVGRLVKEKGVHILIDGYKKANSSKKLVLIGEDQYKVTYEKKLKSVSNSSTIFLGAIYGKDYEELCKGAFAYITASNLEGSSPALIQAMAFGLPTIISNIPQNVEVIGDAGLQFKKNDSDDLSNKIRLLDKDSNLAEQMSQKAKQRIKKKYNWETIVDDLEIIYSRQK